MSRERGFAAILLESNATALAGYATERLFELAPDAQSQFSDGASGGWRAHLSSRLVELATAVRLGEPSLFVNRVLWARRAFVARDVPLSHLELSLTALEDVLGRELPETVGPEVVATVRSARQALEDPSRNGTEGEDSPSAVGELTLRYLAAVLEGNARDAIDLLVAEVGRGTHPREVISNVLVPAQREIGMMWHAAQSDVAEEHLLTATTLRALSVLGSLASPGPSNGKSVVVAAVEGNDHEIAVHSLGLFFEWDGWKSMVLGANVPSVDLVRAVQYFDADLLVLSVTLGIQLKEAARAIGAVRAIADFRLPVLVGGQAFDDHDALWRRIGADGYASSLGAAVAEGRRLVAE